MGEKVTDDELIRKTAEVMGWAEDCCKPAWSPLTSDADAMMLVDRLEHLGFSYMIKGTPTHSSFMGWVEFNRGVNPPATPSASAAPMHSGPESRRRAIVLAAINALAIPANPQ